MTAKASEAAHRGEALFRKPFAEMDGQSCATCHIPSGNFLDRKAHTIGSQVEGYGGARDGAYDTPTLLGARFTAPYFHDGSLPTLASVVDWFNDRYHLGLSDDERADLTAYVEAVGDSDTPYQTFDAVNTEFRLDWKELTTFAGVLDTLLPKRDAFHARLLIETVGPKLADDAGEMAEHRRQVRGLQALRHACRCRPRDRWSGLGGRRAALGRVQEPRRRDRAGDALTGSALRYIDGR